MSPAPEKSAAKAAQEELTRQLDERVQDQLKRYIRAHVSLRIRRREGTDDILHDALKSCVESDAVIKDPEKLLPCLWTCVKRKCANAVRKHKAAKRDVEREVSLDSSSGNEELATRELGSAEAAILYEELDRLSGEEFVAVDMRLHGHTYREIGDTLHCSDDTARRRVLEVKERWSAESGGGDSS